MEDLERLIHYGDKGMKWDKDKKKFKEETRRESDNVIDMRGKEATKKNIQAESARKKNEVQKAIISAKKKAELKKKGIAATKKEIEKLKASKLKDLADNHKRKAIEATNLKKEREIRTKAALFVRNMSKKQEIRRKEQEDWKNRSTVEKIMDKLKKKKKPKYQSTFKQ